MKKGLFITFEGPEGAGKSTQARRLAGWLKGRGRKVLQAREPGGTPLGDRLRRLLLDSRQEGMDPLEELFLYEAARAALVDRVIRPALRAGKTVILDRFQDSTWVYQGWAGGMDLEFIERLGKTAARGLVPDLTILLDLPVRQGLARVTRPNRMERKPVGFHEKVRRGYLALARRNPSRFRRIRADRPAGEVQRRIREAVGDAAE